MLTISHRGYCAHAIENTLEAFKAAANLGVDGIETDIRMTSDGRLVLYHDRRIPDGRAVSRIAYRELCDEVGFTVPTVQEALQWSDRLLWVLELKDVEAAGRLMDVLTEFEQSRRLLVVSFWHNAMQKIQQRSKIPCAPSVAHRPIDFATSQLADWSTVLWKFEYIDASLIQESAQCGCRNMVFHVDGLEEHKRCSEVGVDAVITDEPNLIAETLGDLAPDGGPAA